jgi:predicted  nucleic acid-binding Zn-ribbon protein
MAWASFGVAIGLAFGWLMSMRRIRAERHRLEQEQRNHVQQARAEATALSCSLRRARNRLAELESIVPDLEARLDERNRKVAKLQSQIIDRESTINSLRSRLYGARISATLLEEQLESLQYQHSTIDAGLPESASSAGGSSSLTVSLGDGLVIEMTPQESRTIGSG